MPIGTIHACADFEDYQAFNKRSASFRLFFNVDINTFLSAGGLDAASVYYNVLKYTPASLAHPVQYEIYDSKKVSFNQKFLGLTVLSLINLSLRPRFRVQFDDVFRVLQYLELTYRFLASFGPLTWWTGVVGGIFWG